jgi:hypothetical protein
MRYLSNTIFAFAFASLVLLKSCGVETELVILAACSLASAFFLTLTLRIRSLGLAGLAGYSLVYSQLSESSLTAVPFLALSAVFCILAICLAMLADLPIFQ